MFNQNLCSSFVLHLTQSLDQLTSDELILIDWGMIGFVSSQLRLREASFSLINCAGQASVKGWWVASAGVGVERSGIPMKRGSGEMLLGGGSELVVGI